MWAQLRSAQETILKTVREKQLMNKDPDALPETMEARRLCHM
jgi:hypothetical protein